MDVASNPLILWLTQAYPSGPWLSLLESPGLGRTVSRRWPPPTRRQRHQSRVPHWVQIPRTLCTC